MSTLRAKDFEIRTYAVDLLARLRGSVYPDDQFSVYMLIFDSAAWSAGPTITFGSKEIKVTGHVRVLAKIPSEIRSDMGEIVRAAIQDAQGFDDVKSVSVTVNRVKG